MDLKFTEYWVCDVQKAIDSFKGALQAAQSAVNAFIELGCLTKEQKACMPRSSWKKHRRHGQMKKR